MDTKETTGVQYESTRQTEAKTEKEVQSPTTNPKAGDIIQEIRTDRGLVIGSAQQLEDGSYCDVFFGIPYAKPPVGPLRFKKPEKPDSWETPLQCVTYKPKCTQETSWWDVLTGNGSSEDCLYLNVFAPQVREVGKYPVFFYIHGGGFVSDGCRNIKPKRMCGQIVRQKIVVVTVGYRLGYLGFFSTGDEACEGNLGLYDILAALQWTRQNIAKFGGKPDDITVGGSGSGAICADLLSISPLSRDLFKRKILMGGTSFSHWGTTTKEAASYNCRNKAHELNWTPPAEAKKGLNDKKTAAENAKESEKLLEFLREIPAKKFIAQRPSMDELLALKTVFLAPVLESEFFPKPLRNLREEAPAMDTLIGVGKNEALVSAALNDDMKYEANDFQKLIQGLALKCKNTDPKKIKKQKKQTRFEEFMDEMSRIYGFSDMLNFCKEACTRTLVTMCSDIQGNLACWKYLLFARSQKMAKRTFAYSFDFCSKRQFGSLAKKLPFLSATSETDAYFLLGTSSISNNVPWGTTPVDRALSRAVASYFTSFIKTGNPNSPETSMFMMWEQVPKKGQLNIFSIDVPPRMRKEVFGDRIRRLEVYFNELFYNEIHSAARLQSLSESEKVSDGKERQPLSKNELKDVSKKESAPPSTNNKEPFKSPVTTPKQPQKEGESKEGADTKKIPSLSTAGSNTEDFHKQEKPSPATKPSKGKESPEVSPKRKAAPKKSLENLIVANKRNSGTKVNETKDGKNKARKKASNTGRKPSKDRLRNAVTIQTRTQETAEDSKALTHKKEEDDSEKEKEKDPDPYATLDPRSGKKKRAKDGKTKGLGDEIMTTMDHYAKNDNPRLHTEFDLGKSKKSGKNSGNDSSDRSKKTEMEATDIGPKLPPPPKVRKKKTKQKAES